MIVLGVADFQALACPKDDQHLEKQCFFIRNLKIKDLQNIMYQHIYGLFLCTQLLSFIIPFYNVCTSPSLTFSWQIFESITKFLFYKKSEHNQKSLLHLFYSVIFQYFQLTSAKIKLKISRISTKTTQPKIIAKHCNIVLIMTRLQIKVGHQWVMTKNRQK